MTKILFIGNAASPHFAKWVDYFKRDFEVILVTDKEGELGLKTYRAKSGRGALQIWRLHQKLKEAIKKEKPDIVHVHYVSKYGWPTLGCKIKRLVCTIWGSDFRLSRGISKVLTKKVLSNASVVTTDSEKITQEVAGAVLIKFGVDTNKFKAPKKWVRNKNVLIYTRGFKEIYNAETIILALELLRSRGRDVEAIMCGEGHEKFEGEQIKGLKFVGNIPHKKMAKYYLKSGIYVSTSKFDAGISIGTAEAMAMGIPVVISDVCENRRWISEGINGMLFEYGNCIDLAEKIEYLLDRPTEADKIGQRGRAIIVEKNEYKTEMERMKIIYNKISGAVN